MGEFIELPANNILFGGFQFTQLNIIAPETCRALSRYQQFFDVDGNCYSPILHAEFLRLFANYGVLFSFFIYICLYRIFRFQFSRLQSLSLLSVFLFCALGISALGNSFMILAALILRGYIFDNEKK